jgi:hypothetical protein
MRAIVALLLALAGCSLTVDYTGTYYECGPNAGWNPCARNSRRSRRPSMGH